MKRKLDPDLQRQADALAAMLGEEIDTQDIPEAPAEAWQHAHRPDFCRPLKKTVTLQMTGRSHSEIMATMPEDRRRRIEARTKELIAGIEDMEALPGQGRLLHP